MPLPDEFMENCEMSKQEEADLILKLYDLRREPVMREARNWWFTFNPTTSQDFVDVLMSDKGAYYRMVVSYWEMAAALVNNGAIDEKMFNEANGEQIFVYMKIQQFLPELRAMFNNPEMLGNFEKLVLRVPDIEKRLPEMRERMKQFMAMAEERAKAKAAGGQ